MLQCDVICQMRKMEWTQRWTANDRSSKYMQNLTHFWADLVISNGVSFDARYGSVLSSCVISLTASDYMTGLCSSLTVNKHWLKSKVQSRWIYWPVSRQLPRKLILFSPLSRPHVAISEHWELHIVVWARVIQSSTMALRWIHILFPPEMAKD